MKHALVLGCLIGLLIVVFGELNHKLKTKPMKKQIYLVFKDPRVTAFELALAFDDKDYESSLQDGTIGFIQLNHLPTSSYNAVMEYLIGCQPVPEDVMNSIKILLKYKGTHDKH